MNFRVIDESELEDFRTALHEAGYTPDDFVLTEEADPLPTCGIGFETGIVTVRNVKTGIEGIYPIGHGTTWPTDTALDIGAGFFK
jgi:hypothetical protein